jgi:hypothetical protein
MSDGFRPAPAEWFSFGLWTVDCTARDMLEAPRPALDPVPRDSRVDQPRPPALPGEETVADLLALEHVMGVRG